LRHSRAGQRVGTVSRWSLAEAGIALKLVSSELMSLLDAGRQGKFEAHLIGWSGRVDPDLNVTPLLSCKAAGNDGRYCNPALDELLAQAWATADVATRKALYAQVTATILDDAPVIYLHDPVWIFATTAKLKGFKAFPDGTIRLEGVTPVR
jgi:peptide/nickel transport system substrate-binding protein